MAKTSITISLAGDGGITQRRPDIYPNHEDRTIIMSGNDNQYADGIVNPIPRLGYLSPATAEVIDATVGNSLELIGSTIVDSITSSLYFLERGSKLWRRSQLTATPKRFEVKNEVPGTTGTDLEYFTLAGVRHLFYAFKNASTSAGIGTYNTSTGVLNNTWNYDASISGVTGSLEFGNSELKMTTADNGFMYIIDTNSVHKVAGGTDDGTYGTITANVLLFPASYRLIDSIDANGFMWFSLMQTSEQSSATNNVFFMDAKAGVYIWNRSTTTADNPADYIPITGVLDIKSIHAFQGGIICFTISATQKTQLRVYNNQEFVVVEELELNARPEFHDAVNNTGDRIVWQGKDGKFYSYGKLTPRGENILLKLGDMSRASVVGTGETYGGSGAILGHTRRGGDEHYYISVKSNNYAVLVKFPPFGLDSEQGGWGTVLDGDYYSLVKQLPKTSYLEEITIFFPAQPLVGVITSTLAIMDVDIYINNSSTTIKTVTLTGNDRLKGYKRILVGQHGVNNYQLGLGWKENVTGQYTITPSHAEIVFDPDRRRKI